MGELNHIAHRNPWLERLVLFGVAFAFWLVLTWPVSPVDGRLLIADIASGAAAALIVALVMRDMIRVNLIRLLNPRSWFWLFVYLFVFSWYVVKGGLDVTYRVLHPQVLIRPGIVKLRCTLITDTGRTALASSITLTPGTLTIDVTDDGLFYVHWLNVTTSDEEEAAQLVLRRFEWFIRKIFE